MTQAELLVSWLLEANIVVAGKTTKRNHKFDKMLASMPGDAQNLAREVYDQWVHNPFDRRLEFKSLECAGGRFYSIRIGVRFRAICYAGKDTWLWCWFGTHEAYNKVLHKVGGWPPPTLP